MSERPGEPRPVCSMHAHCDACQRSIYGSAPDTTCAPRADCALKQWRAGPSGADPTVLASDIAAVRDFIRASGGLPDDDVHEAGAIFLSRRLAARGGGSGPSGADGARPTIRLLGDPVLRQRAAKLEGDPAELLERLDATMRAANGIGLAAPQIGLSVRVAVIDLEGTGSLDLVNPRIVWQSEQRSTQREGCLSIPGYEVPITRPDEVMVETDTERVTLYGMQARAAQHEIDHLDGILILDRWLEQVRAGFPSTAQTAPQPELYLWEGPREVFDALVRDAMRWRAAPPVVETRPHNATIHDRCGACGHERFCHDSAHQIPTRGCSALVDSAWTITNTRGCGCSRLRSYEPFDGSPVGSGVQVAASPAPPEPPGSYDALVTVRLREEGVKRERDALREALRPFAGMVEYIPSDEPDSQVYPVLIGDLRAARAALAARPTDPTTEKERL